MPRSSADSASWGNGTAGAAVAGDLRNWKDLALQRSIRHRKALFTIQARCTQHKPAEMATTMSLRTALPVRTPAAHQAMRPRQRIARAQAGGTVRKSSN